MNCERARTQIALWAGGDLDGRAAAQLQRHVALCPECGAYRQQMKSCLRALQEQKPGEEGERQDSVWPALAERLPSRDETRRAARLNRWLPAAAVAVACLALIAFTSEPEPRQQNLYGRLLLAVPLDGGGGIGSEPATTVRDDFPRGTFGATIRERGGPHDNSTGRKYADF